MTPMRTTAPQKDEPGKLSLPNPTTSGRSDPGYSQAGAESSCTAIGGAESGSGELGSGAMNAATRPSRQRRISLDGSSPGSPWMALAVGSCSDSVVISPVAEVSSDTVHSAGIASLPWILTASLSIEADEVVGNSVFVPAPPEHARTGIQA